MDKDIFITYHSREEAQDAFRKMLHIKEEWRAQVRECESRLAL